MLQLTDLNRRARATLPRETFDYRTMEELEAAADGAVSALRAERARLASSPIDRARVWIERRVDTDTVEYLDRPEHPASLKLQQVRWLHAQNVVLRSYPRYLGLLEPSIAMAVAARHGAKARLLELACGSGELTLALARLAQARGLAAEITGSDVVPAYVEDASRRAREASIPARFRVLNAFELSRALVPGEVDVAFIVQSMHHFTPGQLARMIAQVGAAGARRFVGMDGRRGLLMLGALPAFCALSLNRHFAHDALVSMRRLHAEAELALVASIAAPDARVRVRSHGGILSVLEVDYGAGGAT